MIITLQIEKRCFIKPPQNYNNSKWVPVIQTFPNFHPENTESVPLPLYDDKSVDKVRNPLMTPKTDKGCVLQSKIMFEPIA